MSHHTLHGRVSAPQKLIDKHLSAGAPATGLHNATYLAAIEHLDNSVGRLMQKLDDLKLRENTLVVFLSDNGGVDTQCVHPEVNIELLSGETSLAQGKQEFDNAPLREGKGSVYEGGIRVPCLVRWPAEVAAQTVNDTPIHVVDWYPTLLSAASALSQDPTDGVDLVPVLHGGTLPPRPLYWYLPLYDLLWASTPAAVIRDGDWKLIEFFGDRFDAQSRYHVGPHRELYNLKLDIGETTSLADVHPEQVDRMRQKLTRWVKSIPAKIPEFNPHFDSSKAFLKTKEKQSWQR